MNTVHIGVRIDKLAHEDVRVIVKEFKAPRFHRNLYAVTN